MRRSSACVIVRKIHADMFLGVPKDEDVVQTRGVWRCSCIWCIGDEDDGVLQILLPVIELQIPGRCRWCNAKGNGDSLLRWLFSPTTDESSLQKSSKSRWWCHFLYPRSWWKLLKDESWSFQKCSITWSCCVMRFVLPLLQQKITSSRVFWNWKSLESSRTYLSKWVIPLARCCCCDHMVEKSLIPRGPLPKAADGDPLIWMYGDHAVQWCRCDGVK